jgi:acylphosphatase
MLRLRIRGKVQRVGFRAWAVDTAQSLGLRGWVRNRKADRSVEIVAAGPKAALDAFVAACHTGPELARVKSVDVEDADEQVGDSFTDTKDGP